MPPATSPRSFISAAGVHWRKFLPMWLFPIPLCGVPFLHKSSDLTKTLFLVALALLLLVCGYVATAPRRQGQATWAQTLFWAAVMPYLIWAVIMLGVLGL